MGTVATTFMIVGLVLAFLAFHWVKVSTFAFVFIVLFAFTEGLPFAAPWLRFVVIILISGLAVTVYGHSVILITSLWGGLTIAIDVTENLPIPKLGTLFIGIAIATIGACAQYQTNDFDSLVDQNFFLFRKYYQVKL
jgi:hypothetical protein